MTLTRNLRFFALLLALSTVLALAGCDMGGQLLPGVDPGDTTGSTEGESPVSTPTEPPVQTLPAYGRELEAVQCYYNGELQREYALTYDEQGRISGLTIHTYDKGSLYSWGEYRYQYDAQGNLAVNDYTHSLGTQRWEYENEYNEYNVLAAYQETEYYNGNLVSQHREDCFYDAAGRYLGNTQPENVTFDEYGRCLTMSVRVERGDYLADMNVACDYSCMPVVLCDVHTVFPEYAQFASYLRLMLNEYHILLSLDMKEGYQTVIDSEGFLTRVTDENGSDVFVFIYQ